MKLLISKILTLTAVSSLFYHTERVNAFSPLSSNIVGKAMKKKATNDITNALTGPKTKKIERDWTFTDDNGDEYEASGNMSVKVFLPKKDNVKGCIFFMHGFSQYTKAYEESLERVSNNANVAVFSVDTGIVSWIVLKELLSNPIAFIKDRSRLQFVLQRALSQDTKQCIEMISNGDDKFKEFNIKKNLPRGICGHSMGGGLSFPVAADCKVNYVFTMAPLSSEVAEFNSIERGVDKHAAGNSMLLAGSWDLIAKASQIEEIAKASNSKRKNSSIFVDIDRGLHTGFEDDLVITKVSLDDILAKLFDLPNLAETILFGLLNFLRTNTGQLEGSEQLMIYFFDKMTKGQSVTAKEAKEFLQENIKEEWYEKFNIN